MNQKHKKYLWGCLAVGLIVAIGVICLLRPKKTYESYIPAQAKAVVRIEAERLHDFVTDYSLIEGIDLKTCGIDWSQSVYAFITPNEYIGFTSAIANAQTFGEQMEALAKSKKCQLMEAEGGQHWAWLESGWLLTWNEHSFLALGPGIAQERDILRQTTNHLLEADEPFSETQRFKTMTEQSGGLILFAQLDALPSPYNLLFRSDIPTACDPAAVQIYASADFNNAHEGKTETRISCNITAEDENVLKALDAFSAQKESIELSLSLQNDSALFVMATQTNGEEMINLLKTNQTFRDALIGINQAIEFNRIIGATDGIVCLEISHLSKDWTPTFCLKAEASDFSAFDDAEEWMKNSEGKTDEQLKRINANAFELRNGNEQVIFGMNPTEKFCYFASPSFRERVTLPLPYEKTRNPEGVISFFRLNLQTLFSQPALQEGSVANLLRMLLPGAHHVTYESHKRRKAVLTFE